MCCARMTLITLISLHQAKNMPESYLDNSTNAVLASGSPFLKLVHGVYDADEMHNLVEYVVSL